MRLAGWSQVWKKKNWNVRYKEVKTNHYSQGYPCHSILRMTRDPSVGVRGVGGTSMRECRRSPIKLEAILLPIPLVPLYQEVSRQERNHVPSREGKTVCNKVIDTLLHNFNFKWTSTIATVWKGMMTSPQNLRLEGQGSIHHVSILDHKSCQPRAPGNSRADEYPCSPKTSSTVVYSFFFLFSFPPTRILEGLFLDLLTLYKPTGSEQHKQGIVVKACVYATQNFRSPTTVKFEESCLVQDFSPPQEQPASTDWWKKKKDPQPPASIQGSLRYFWRAFATSENNLRWRSSRLQWHHHQHTHTINTSLCQTLVPNPYRCCFRKRFPRNLCIQISTSTIRHG